MTRGREAEALLEVPHGSVGKTGGRNWAKEREMAGINPNDETANMSPSEAIAYRLLRNAKFVPNQTFYDAVFEGRKLKDPPASLSRVMVGLRSKLPKSIGSTVVSVRSEGNSGYVLAALGEGQETIERYKREEEVRYRTAADLRIAIRASGTIVGKIEALLNLGGEVTTDVIFDSVFGGRRTKNNLTEISRAIRKIDEKAQEKGHTLVRSQVGERRIYAIVNSEDAEKVKNELARKGTTDHAPKVRTIPKSPSQEIILKEDVEVNIIALDDLEELDVRVAKSNHGLSFLDARKLREKMSPEEIRTTWQRIAWDATEMFLSRMVLFGTIKEGIGIEKNFEVILGAILSAERLEMFKKSTTISLPDFINAIRGTIEEAWAQTMTPRQAEYAYMDKKYIRILIHRDILKKQHASIEFVLKSLYEHFGLDIPAEYETAVSPYKETAPRPRRRYPSHRSLKL